ncbi:MAG: T9SS type A sorting domain-containing protein [Prolixibacteraceae bacterium]|nr:T9SS type A sorting domain-containing protein [Prolixibacteraceae bacterium]
MKQSRVTLLIIYFLTSSFFSFGQFSDGDGTALNPYQITSIDELNNVRNYLDKHFILMNDLDFEGTEFSRENSVNGWNPIGDDSKPFTGSFNGDGHYISNLFINRPESSVGLFRFTKGANIEKLVILNSKILGGDTVGILSAEIESTTISCCISNGEISGEYFVGGLIGYSHEASLILNSYSTCSISGSIWVVLGGIVGLNISSTLEFNYSCSKFFNKDAGGIAGFNDSGEIHNCFYNEEVADVSVGIFADFNNDQLVIGLSSNEMKNQVSFTSWDFESVWEITEGFSFPKIREVYDPPIILPDLRSSVKANNEYIDTVSIIVMDYQPVVLSIDSGPEGMTLTNNIIHWNAPAEEGDYLLKILADDTHSNVFFEHVVNVVQFNGDGSLSDPYQIESISDLNLSRNYLDKNFILMNDLDFNQSPYCSDSSETGWVPIGTYSSPFYGTLDENNKIISNLFINRPDSSYVGLWGFVSNGTIKNLCLTNCLISGGEGIGSVSGYSEYATIINCRSSGEIFGNSTTGGLVGDSFNDSIEYCYSNCIIQVEGSGPVGGLFGQSSSLIKNCYSTGNIFCNGSSGGLVGNAWGGSEITNCYSIGKIYGYGSYSGGFIGMNNGITVKNSFFSRILSGIEKGIGYNHNNQTVNELSINDFKKESSFTNWNFDSIWKITEGISFPGIRSLYNNPILLSSNNLVKNSELFTDTLQIIEMDNSQVNAVIKNGPEEMSINNNIVSWNASNELGTYPYSIQLNGSNPETVDLTFLINVHSFLGDGSIGNPFQINTITKLDSVRYFSNKDFILLNDLDFYGSIYSRENSSSGWIPIESFSGSFNGNGLSISNLFIHQHHDGLGLFHDLIGATIHNLNLKGYHIIARDTIGSLIYYGDNIGALAGSIFNSNIYECSTTGVLYGGENLGGITGRNSTYSNISNCFSGGTIDGIDVSKSFEGNGGIAGSNMNFSNISNCYFKGMVFGGDDVGGLVGFNYNSSNIINCYSIPFFSKQGSDVGGILGVFDSGTISNCFYYDGYVGIGNSYGTPLSYDELKNQEIYIDVGWDFLQETENGINDYWGIDESGEYNEGFSFLSWQGFEHRVFPEVTTLDALFVKNTSRILKGNLIETGYPTPTDHGFCLSTNTNPDTTDIKISLGSITDAGEFQETVNNLNPCTTYYIRAYASNTAGTTYGDEVSFTTLSSVPVDYQASDITLTSGESACYNAQNIVTVAGDDSDVILESGSAATFIAGYSIQFLNGFHAHPGCYMSAYITTIGSFCDPLAESIVYEETYPEKKSFEIQEEDNTGEDILMPSLKVYPNPSNGNITVELQNFNSNVDLRVINSQGRVLRLISTDENDILFDLSNVPKGIYLIRANDQEKQLTQKIIIE